MRKSPPKKITKKREPKNKLALKSKPNKAKIKPRKLKSRYWEIYRTVLQNIEYNDGYLLLHPSIYGMILVGKYIELPVFESRMNPGGQVNEGHSDKGYFVFMFIDIVGEIVGRKELSDRKKKRALLLRHLKGFNPNADIITISNPEDVSEAMESIGGGLNCA